MRAQLSATGGNGAVDNHENNDIGYLQNQVQLLANENAHLKSQISSCVSENERLVEESNQLKMLKLSLESASDQNKCHEIEQKLRLEQENLLELLADQDMKLTEYRQKLRTLGEKIDDSDDDC